MKNIVATLKINDPELQKQAGGTEFSYELDGVIMIGMPNVNFQPSDGPQEASEHPNAPFGFMGGEINPVLAAATILGIPQIGKMVYEATMRQLLEAPVVSVDQSELPEDVKEALTALIKRAGWADEQEEQADTPTQEVPPQTNVLPFTAKH